MSPSPSQQRLLRRVGERVLALDTTLDVAVATTPTPRLDPVLRALTRSADHSGLWFATSLALALGGGAAGRRAAADGLLAVAAASATTNLVAKQVFPRRRPPAQLCHGQRHPARAVARPASSSFPSGHAASAFAFAGAAGRELPALTVPLHLLAALVAYSRVHCAVHYPLDVLAGAAVGATAGAVISRARAARRR
ncbi:MAG TPA: phosphatase PAP2 family protein [Marmoricola sp.]|nr:phosphatase PAP2 family protein [Marmoricola sp.]